MNAGPPRIAIPDDPWQERELTEKEQAERLERYRLRRAAAMDDALGYRLGGEQKWWDRQHEEEWKKVDGVRVARGRDAQRAFRAICKAERQAAHARKRNERVARRSHWWTKFWDWLAHTDSSSSWGDGSTSDRSR